MKNKIPIFSDNLRICVICEGNEEYEYLDRLKSLEVWNNKYSIALDNAGGNGNISARYQDKFQNGSYDIVLVFCDTEKKPCEQYESIKQKINDFHGIESAANEVVMFANPCTMQIILSHWIDVKLKSPAKKVNAPLIKNCTGVENYKGREDQRKQVFASINKENYKKMYDRVKSMPEVDTIIGSTNFGRFIKYFTNDDDEWIRDINERLE